MSNWPEEFEENYDEEYFLALDFANLKKMLEAEEEKVMIEMKNVLTKAINDAVKIAKTKEEEREEAKAMESAWDMLE
jgi:hypothetical protein